MSTLDRAIALATDAHTGQTDKARAPYILHPLRVMLRMATDEERIVAVLHDVVEDCEQFTFDDLRRLGFSENVVRAVEALTKQPDEKGTDEGYLRFVARAARHPIARAVKIADLEDNMDLTRIAAPTAEDHARVERYRRALEIIRSAAADA